MEDQSSQRDIKPNIDGPKRLLQSLLYSQFHPEIISQKNLLGQKSKFKIALQTLQEDYRPSESVSCRDEQKITIEKYLRESLTTQGCSQSLYISGVPGIGKTLCVKEVVGKIQKQFPSQSMKIIYANALSMKRPVEVFRFIYYQLTNNICDPSTAMYKLNQYFEKGVTMKPPPQNSYSKEFSRESISDKQKLKYLKMKKVLVLDQVDYLKTRDEQVLYNIFEWTQKKKSHLIIISISNTTDFPDHLSLKVNSRIGNKRLVFKPYVNFQVEQILNQRIKNLDVFDQHAITYICKKIVVCSSDIRKCLNVLRQAIYQFIHIQKLAKKNLRDQDLKNKKITVQILAKVQDRIYKDLFYNVFSDFPSTYKIILYFLAKHFRSENTSCSMRKLEHLCTGFVKEYNQLISTLADLKDLGIIKIAYTYQRKDVTTFSDYPNMKQLRQQRITLNIPNQKIVFALQKEDLKELSKGFFKMDFNF